ncbi:MAG: two-component regulator propeller domain-containing protein [Pseudomonadota bacterium]
MKSPLMSYGRIFSLLVILSCCLSSQARSTSAASINLHHSSWTVRDGAPAMILSMTQTQDGWLWLGGPTGLYRFDGIQFEQFAPSNAPLLTRNVSVVNAFADGSLWIGYRTGGAAQLRHGRIRNYSERDGLPGRSVWGVEQDGDGRVWAATAQGMYYLENERWQAPASSWEVPGGQYKTLMRDRQGVLWAQCDTGVYFLRPGSKQFAKAPVSSGTGVLFNLPDGSVVSWDAGHARFNQLAGPAQGGYPQHWEHLGDPASLLFDHRGDLWIGLKGGLEYRTASGVSGRTTPPQGLSGPSVGAIFEDREGNVWAATSSGVDRFRSRRLARIEVPESAIGAAILADDSGGAWIGGFHVSSSNAGQARITPLWPANQEGWADMLTGFTRTSDGVLWGSSYGALRRIQGKDSRRIALPATIGNRVVKSVLADQNGDLLAAVQHLGLYRRRSSGEWEKTGNEGEVSVMARSDALGLWLGYFPGRVAHAEGAGWRNYGPADGLTVGLVMALHLHGRHVWAGGDNGLALFEAGRFQQVGGLNGETFDGISGIVELDNGDLWLNATAGLFRIASEEIAKFKRAPGYRVQYERLDQLDGLEGSAPRLVPSPSLVLSSDSRLWIVRTTGVFRLNPREQLPLSPAQPAIIKTIGPPGEGKAAQEHAQFAPGVSALQIDYTIPSLAMPERVRFRYRLEEVDADWQEVGARRNAYYSNLAPGDYHFRVAASDYNGKWAGQHTMAHFTIAPAMTETWWFKALCGALLLSAAYLAYRWHINRMSRQMAHRLQERVSERERIARELHDTLLQSVQSLILHIHAAVMKMPPKDAMRMQLENVLQQADDVVDEGRGRIRELRGEDDKLSFPDALLAAANRLHLCEASAIQLKMSGALRQLDGAIYQEAMAIVIEAIANACSHARAQRIEVELQYGMREFRCIVRDDGVGIPAEILGDGGRRNHWGMRGMAERAARINAKLVLRSSAETGTEWQLTLPGALAYTQ